MNTELDWKRLAPLIQSALDEDWGTGDVTTDGIVPPGLTGRAVILAKQSGVTAGIHVSGMVFKKTDSGIHFETAIQDGSAVEPGTVLAVIDGPLNAILKAERTALNFIQRLSGIATLTSKFVSSVQGTKVKILDTRKTTPLWRVLEKYAVRMGGGQNHRFGLYDMALIKDNHIAAAGGDVAEAIRRCLGYLKKNGFRIAVEVEAKTLEQVRTASRFPIQRILLDNMDLETMGQAVAYLEGKIETEASGGVNLDNARRIAETGVDFISIGTLTHSAPALDISLDVS